ncbi:MAG TPA: hypothetical protein VFT56_08530 [Sphingomonas sp.]|nr:hypothetical protein [Sphingomonas sp.]
MRLLKTNEIDQVSGAGLLGLNLNLNVLDILGVHANVDVGDDCDGRGRSDDRCGRERGHRGDHRGHGGWGC